MQNSALYGLPSSPTNLGTISMTAYMVAQIKVNDPHGYKNYLAEFFPIFERHGGEVLATSACETEVIEGDWALPKTVIMKFPSLEHARSWYADPDYKALAEHRHKSAEANLVLVEGL
jgi:uncharacterized protein (DUF1330 family)